MNMLAIVGTINGRVEHNDLVPFSQPIDCELIKLAVNDLRNRYGCDEFTLVFASNHRPGVMARHFNCVEGAQEYIETKLIKEV